MAAAVVGGHREGDGEDDGRINDGIEFVAAATGAAQSQGVPLRDRLQSHVGRSQDAEELFGLRRVGRVACGGHQKVGVLAVGDGERLLVQGPRRRRRVDEAAASTHVAAESHFRIGVRDQQFALGHLAGEFSKARRVAVAVEVDDLDAVHGEHQGAGDAVGAERAYRGDHVGEGGVAAAQLRGEHGREETTLLESGDRLVREARVHVHVIGVHRGDVDADAPGVARPASLRFTGRADEIAEEFSHGDSLHWGRRRGRRHDGRALRGVQPWPPGRPRRSGRDRVPAPG